VCLASIYYFKRKKEDVITNQCERQILEVVYLIFSLLCSLENGHSRQNVMEWWNGLVLLVHIKQDLGLGKIVVGVSVTFNSG